MGAAVEVEGLWEGYRPKSQRGKLRRHSWHWALHDVSFEVAAGGFLGVVGGNGSGKTTLLRVVGGVLPPSRGKVVTNGRVASLIDLAAGVSRELTGHENLLIGGVLLGLSRAEVRRHYDDIVAFTGLTEEMLAQPIHTYSSGMVLRQVIATVLHSDPSVLLVDEVLAVADEGFRNRCIERIQELRAGGCAVVMVSHELELLAATSERVAMLEKGSLEFLGPPDEALTRYRAWAAADATPAPPPPLWGQGRRR